MERQPHRLLARLVTHSTQFESDSCLTPDLLQADVGKGATKLHQGSIRRTPDDLCVVVIPAPIRVPNECETGTIARLGGDFTRPDMNSQCVRTSHLRSVNYPNNQLVQRLSVDSLQNPVGIS